MWLHLLYVSLPLNVPLRRFCVFLRLDAQLRPLCVFLQRDAQLRPLCVFLQRDVRLLELELQRFGVPLLSEQLLPLYVFLRRDVRLLPPYVSLPLNEPLRRLYVFPLLSERLRPLYVFLLPNAPDPQVLALFLGCISDNRDYHFSTHSDRFPHPLCHSPKQH